MSNRSIVFSGGGVAGIAWELGMLLGFEDAEPGLLARLLDPKVSFVGTSAGSVVASQVAGGTSLESLYLQQLAEESAEIGAIFDPVVFGQTLARILEGSTSAEESRRRLGTFAREAETATCADRRAVIAARLPVQTWPERRVLLTAVDTETGALRVFDKTSGVDLVDAVGASCAVPGIWPTVEIEGHQYMDGGMRSISNADLAAATPDVSIHDPASDADRVLVLVPSSENPAPGALQAMGVSQAEIDVLAPASVLVLHADDASVTAFGPNSLDPAVRPASAIAGREQGRAVAAKVAAFFS
jgi:NTE family protein